ncbi:MAG TPA: alanyl-tRNA editing protein [Burkholderiales bacterium]|jgi:misacylated tRNA(Ala) deacylase|nr:alanyl-tRNA editing protein [Burkholderiales bacterium]
MTDLIFYNDPYLRVCAAEVVRVGEDGIVLNRTIFYPTGGGQPGDNGTLRTEDGREAKIVDTRKGARPDEVVHVPAPGGDPLRPGDRVIAAIDWDRRHHHMRVHTSLHLLSAVIPAAVTGGSVRYDSGRLDFDLPDTVLDREEVEEKLNRLIAGSHGVVSRWITGQELDARPELVKTMSVAPPRGLGRVRLVEIRGVDLQACGGTHVACTAEIGSVQIVKIENKGAHNRRVTIALKSPGTGDA